jgi:hypothetical protein
MATNEMSLRVRRLSGLARSESHDGPLLGREYRVSTARTAAYVVLRDGRQFTSGLVASSGVEVDTGRVSARVVVDGLNQLLVDRRSTRVQST